MRFTLQGWEMRAVLYYRSVVVFHCFIIVAAKVIAGEPLPYESLKHAESRLPQVTEDICNIAYRYTFLYPTGIVVGLFRDPLSDTLPSPRATILFGGEALCYEMYDGRVAQKQENSAKYYPALFGKKEHFESEGLLEALSIPTEGGVFNIDTVKSLSSAQGVAMYSEEVECKGVMKGKKLFSHPEALDELNITVEVLYLKARKEKTNEVKLHATDMGQINIEQLIVEAMEDEEADSSIKQPGTSRTAPVGWGKDIRKIEPYIHIWKVRNVYTHPASFIRY